MKSTLIGFLVFLSLVSQGQTKSVKKSLPLSEGTPESVGMSTERLSRIDTMITKSISNGEIPGAVALVARNGKIVYYKAFGKADNKNGRTQNHDDIFRIASQSKAITATAVMMLWEQGKFRLDDPISLYIPEFKNPQVLTSFRYSDTTYTSVPASQEITIRHLLTHTSGIGYGVIDADERFKMIYAKAGVTDLFTTKSVMIGESIKKLAKLPLHFNPGEDYSYSEGLDVLGYFIEVISGMPFDVYLRKHLFEPLGMKDTWFYLPPDRSKRLVPVQWKEKGEWNTYPVTFYDPDYPVKGARTFFSGGAGLSSTAKDYATFLQMYLNGGELNGIRILSRTSVQTIMQNQTGTLWEDNAGRSYGLVFGLQSQSGVTKGGYGSIGTFEWGGYFNTTYFADPEEKVIGILMKQTQGSSGDSSSWKFQLLVSQAIDD
jgi:CubicO group peptidase (beta-lactamase class C family)